jgi:hypothetical protein
VRTAILAAATLAGASAGCIDATVLPPARDIFQLETWTTVPPDRDEVRAKVGEVLHLPLGSPTDTPALVYLRVEINRKLVDYPEFHSTAKTVSYVFRARQPGRYRVEVHRDFAIRDPAGAADKPSSDAPPKPEPGKDDRPSWPPRAWEVIVSG